MPRTPKAPVSPAAAPMLPAAPAATQLDIQIDLSKLTIGDLRVIGALQQGNVTMTELVDLFDRCVVGGADHLPYDALPQVAKALSQAMEKSSNPKT